MGPPKNKWTEEEEQAFRAGLDKHGDGKWVKIKKDPEFATQLINRSNVDLKDKWRNWTKRAPAPTGAIVPVPEVVPGPTGAIVPVPEVVPGPTGAIVPVPEAVPGLSGAIVPVSEVVPGPSGAIVPADLLSSEFDNMICEALLNLNDGNGSDICGIVSYIEELSQVNAWFLPSNFPTLITVRLERIVQHHGRIEKVQNSYRLRRLNVVATPPTTLDLFPTKDISPSNPQQKPSEPPTNSKPNLIMAEKARVFKWGKCSIQTSPPEALLQLSPRELCSTHEWLINDDIQPKDDIYNQLPSAILQDRKPNGEDMFHIVHTKRYVRGKTICRRIGNFLAEWAEKRCVEVFGIDGEPVGHEFSLCLTFYRDGCRVEGDWSISEFVSVKCEKRDSSVVKLKCSDINWEKMELQVQKAESDLAESYTKKMLIFESQTKLAICISELGEFRKKFKESEEQLLSGCVIGLTRSVEGAGSSGCGLGVEHVGSSTSVTLSLGLGFVDEELQASYRTSYGEIGSDGVLAPTKEKDTDQEPRNVPDVPGEPSRYEPPGGFDDLI